MSQEQLAQRRAIVEFLPDDDEEEVVKGGLAAAGESAPSITIENNKTQEDDEEEEVEEEAPSSSSNANGEVLPSSSSSSSSTLNQGERAESEKVSKSGTTFPENSSSSSASAVPASSSLNQDPNKEEEKNQFASSETSHPAGWKETIESFSDLDISFSHPGTVSLPPPRDAKLANDHKKRGNEDFLRGDYLGACDAYTEAIRFAPLDESASAVFYANRAACYLELARFPNAVEDCTKALELDPKYLKALVRRSKARVALEELDEALSDLNAALEIDPLLHQVKKDRDALQIKVAEKNEKLKNEMMGKLKDLGNTVLGKFGMSLDNFQWVQDPASGSYSVSYKS